jgi:alkylation response protein AidB-like acyl-CoA dehydrogenase
MDFLPSPAQLDLQHGLRELLHRRFPAERLRTATGFDPELWRDLADFGALTVLAKESDGGLGLGASEAVLVAEELGRALVPGPVVGTMVAAAHFGTRAGPVAVLETTDPPLLVEHLTSCSQVLLVTDASVSLVDAGQLAATPVERPLDPLTPLHSVGEVPALGGGDAAELRREATVLTAGLQVGIAARLVDLAVDYAKRRQQFGRSIGSFQAVKHLCADMLVRSELARAAVHTAAVHLDGLADGDTDRAVHGAKLLADEAATLNGRACIQVHGGMGFTWEVEAHLYLKRAWLQATNFGTIDSHADALAVRL